MKQNSQIFKLVSPNYVSPITHLILTLTRVDNYNNICLLRSTCGRKHIIGYIKDKSNNVTTTNNNRNMFYVFSIIIVIFTYNQHLNNFQYSSIHPIDRIKRLDWK